LNARNAVAAINDEAHGRPQFFDRAHAAIVSD
jgi:hypothetical protein